MSDSTQSVAPVSHTALTVGLHRASKRLASVIILAIILICLIDSTIYLWQSHLGSATAHQTEILAAQVAKLNSDISALNDLNNGTVQPTPKSSLPSNQVGLAADKIIFTLPNGWMKAPPTNGSPICVPGTIDAKPMICDDIISVLPSGNTSNTSRPGYDSFQFQVNISVFQYQDGKSAKDWLSSDYGEGLYNMLDPSPINQSNDPINGYDAFTFTRHYTDGSPPDTIYYAIVHGSYAVVVASTYTGTIYPTNGSGTGVIVEYSKYLPDIKTLVDSIKFQ